MMLKILMMISFLDKVEIKIPKMFQKHLFWTVVQSPDEMALGKYTLVSNNDLIH